MDCTRRELNIANGAKRMAETFGRSNNFAILSLSLIYIHALTASNTLSLKNAGIRPKGQYKAFLGTNQGRLACFLSLSDCNIYLIHNKFNQFYSKRI